MEDRIAEAVFDLANGHITLAARERGQDILPCGFRVLHCDQNVDVSPQILDFLRQQHLKDFSACSFDAAYFPGAPVAKEIRQEKRACPVTHLCREVPIKSPDIARPVINKRIYARPAMFVKIMHIADRMKHKNESPLFGENDPAFPVQGVPGHQRSEIVCE
jgi:hypothetical protein